MVSVGLAPSCLDMVLVLIRRLSSISFCCRCLTTTTMTLLQCRCTRRNRRPSAPKPPGSSWMRSLWARRPTTPQLRGACPRPSPGPSTDTATHWQQEETIQILCLTRKGRSGLQLVKFDLIYTFYIGNTFKEIITKKNPILY